MPVAIFRCLVLVEAVNECAARCQNSSAPRQNAGRRARRRPGSHHDDQQSTLPARIVGVQFAQRFGSGSRGGRRRDRCRHGLADVAQRSVHGGASAWTARDLMVAGKDRRSRPSTSATRAEIALRYFSDSPVAAPPAATSQRARQGPGKWLDLDRSHRQPVIGLWPRLDGRQCSRSNRTGSWSVGCAAFAEVPDVTRVARNPA